MEHAPHGYVERQIADAMERGEFASLPGTGRPIPDLGRGDDPAWWAKRRIRRERARDRAHRVAAEAHRTLGRLMAIPDEASLRRKVADLNARIERANAGLGASERAEPLDPDRAVELWRSMARVRR